MSRKKKMYVTIMALCAAALLVDRLVLPAPSAAVAGDADGTINATRALGVSSASARIPAPEIPFPRGVATPPDLSTLRDLFAAPLTLAGAPVTATAVESDARGHGPTGREQFIQSHRLTGILSDGDIAVAIVGDRWLSPGSELDGCVLKTVGAQSAVFVCSDGDATVFLPNVAASDRKNP